MPFILFFVLTPCENTPPARGFLGFATFIKRGKVRSRRKGWPSNRTILFLLLIYGKNSRSRMLFLAVELLGNDRTSRAINPMILTLRSTAEGMLRLALPSESAHFTDVKSSVLYFTSKSLLSKGVNFHESFYYSSSKNEINST